METINSKKEPQKQVVPEIINEWVIEIIEKMLPKRIRVKSIELVVVDGPEACAQAEGQIASLAMLNAVPMVCAEVPEVRNTVPAEVRNTVPAEELCHFIHPQLTSEKEVWEIHGMVKRLVASHGIAEICAYLNELGETKKILLPISSQNAFDELHRLGMPDETKPGFSYKNFCRFYRK